MILPFLSLTTAVGNNPYPYVSAERLAMFDDIKTTGVWSSWSKVWCASFQHRQYLDLQSFVSRSGCMQFKHNLAL